MAKQIVRGRGFKDLTGHKFGRLCILRFAGRDRFGKTCWECQCNCGHKKVVTTCGLLRQDRRATRSCGCLQREKAANAKHTHGQAGRRLQDTSARIGRTRAYRCWCNMIQRCTNNNNPRWDDYGGRGISVCERWKVFESFFQDMGPPLSPRHSLERTDNNGNYDSVNVVWAISKVQARNTRRNRFLTFRGETLTLAAWAERFGVNYRLLVDRLNWGWSAERALTEPTGECCERVLTFRGKTRSLSEWAKIIGVPYNTLYARVVHRKMATDRVLTMPSRRARHSEVGRRSYDRSAEDK